MKGDEGCSDGCEFTAPHPEHPEVVPDESEKAARKAPEGVTAEARDHIWPDGMPLEALRPYMLPPFTDVTPENLAAYEGAIRAEEQARLAVLIEAAHALADWMEPFCGEEFATDEFDADGHQTYIECDTQHQCGNCTRANAVRAALAGLGETK